jgi:hypothetical protein
VSPDINVTLRHNSDIPFPIKGHTPGSSGGNANAASFSPVIWTVLGPHPDNPVYQELEKSSKAI